MMIPVKRLLVFVLFVLTAASMVILYATREKWYPRNGIVKSYYESGLLKGEWNFVKGKLQGPSKEYFESGALKVEWNMKDNKADGLVRTYHEIGALEGEWNYRDGQLHG